MTAQVVFLNTGYAPDPEERRRLEIMAEYIQGARNGLYNRIASYEAYQRIIEVQRFHEAFKKHIRLYEHCTNCKELMCSCKLY